MLESGRHFMVLPMSSAHIVCKLFHPVKNYPIVMSLAPAGYISVISSSINGLSLRPKPEETH